MDNTVQAVCVSAPPEKPTKIRFKLQESLRGISEQPGAYVCGIFDCCREALSEEMRGGGGASPADFDPDAVNHIFWFGCKEGSGVAATSDIAVQFFEQLRKVSNPDDGSVLLPYDMLTWVPGDGGNILPKVQQPLRLCFGGSTGQVSS